MCHFGPKLNIISHITPHNLLNNVNMFTDFYIPMEMCRDLCAISGDKSLKYKKEKLQVIHI